MINNRISLLADISGPHAIFRAIKVVSIVLIPVMGRHMFTNFDEGINTYGCTVTSEWDYVQERPYKGDVIRDKRRIYIHYYYSIEKGADDEQAFDKRIVTLCKELQTGNLVESHRKAYE
ncbi:hypothetical protein AB840_08845, partial [Megasphaera cerevisiae DSM 20462]